MSFEILRCPKCHREVTDNDLAIVSFTNGNEFVMCWNCADKLPKPKPIFDKVEVQKGEPQ